MKLIAVMILAACLSHGQNVPPSDFAPLGRIGMGQWSPLRLNPVAWYQAEDNALDSAWVNNGTWTGTAAYASGKIGRAFDFDGNNTQYIGIGTAGMSASRGTISAWVRHDAVSAGDASKNYSVSGRTTAGNRIYLSTLHAVGTYYIGLGNYFINTGVSIKPLGSWNLFSLTWDSGNYAWFIDGAEEKTGTYTGLTTIPAMAVGGFLQDGVVSDNVFYMTGQIDDVLIFDRALSAAEIKRLYDESTKRNGRAWK